MNLGFWACLILVPCFAVFALIFGIMKEKSVKLLAGFNMFSEEEQAKYDRLKIATDTRNMYGLWTTIMLIGALFSLVSSYFAIAVFAVWLFLLIRDIHLDAHKAFEKYLVK